MATAQRDVISRGGGDAIYTIELLRMPMSTAEQRGAAFGKTVTVAGNLGTHNVQDILEFWLAADRWRDFAYQPARGDAVRVQLLAGEFDYFLSLINWSPQFIDNNLGANHQLKAEAFSHIDPEPSEERRRHIDQVRAEIGPPLGEAIAERPLGKELRQVMRDHGKRTAYRAGRSQTAIAREGRNQIKVDVWDGSDTAALAGKLLADLQARGGDVYTELVGALIEREGWKGLVARRDEHIHRLKAAGLTQRQIAQRVGVSQMEVSRILKQSVSTNGKIPRV